MSNDLDIIGKAFAEFDKKVEKLRSAPKEFMDVFQDQLFRSIDLMDFLGEGEKKKIKKKIRKNGSEILVYHSLDSIIAITIPKGLDYESTAKAGEVIWRLSKIANKAILEN